MIKGQFIYDDNDILVEMYLSYSLISKMFFKGNEIEHCPYQILKTYISGEYSYPSTEAMHKGLYFESKIIGKTADGSTDVEPVTTSKGKPTADQIRIDEQVKLFHSGNPDTGKEALKTKYGLEIREDNVQVKASKQLIVPSLDFNVFVTVTADYLGPVLYRRKRFEKAVIDLKLTGNLMNTFGDFGWGDMERTDKTQAYINSFVFDLPFFYFIFDYPATDMTHRLVKINTYAEWHKKSHDDVMYHETSLRLQEMKETVRKAAINLEYYLQEGWPTNPSIKRCHNCPLSKDCEDSYSHEAEY